MNEEIVKKILKDHGPGLVTMGECKICGYLKWKSTTHETPPFKDLIVREEIDECPRCTEVFRRAPEIFHWVLSVISHHEETRYHGLLCESKQIVIEDRG